jgi:regulator of replication initiation timing
MKKNIKDQTMQALAALLPEDVAKEVLSAVDNLVEGVREELQTEYDAKLEEAYAIVAEQKQKVEEEGYKGYSEAYQIISDLRDRLEVQREEFEHALQEGYEEAYQMLVNERTKNETLEVDLYEEYDRKVKEIKEFFVEKVDLFLSQKGEEFYEQAKRDVLNDPTMAEHKVALDKILEVASNYMSEEDYHFATSAKLDDLSRQVEELRGQCKIVEAKNIRLGNENNRLNEAVRQNAQMINESTRSEQKERAKKAKTAEGRGRRNVEVIL